MLQVSIAQNAREVEGVWTDYSPAPGVRFLIARAGNPDFLRATDKHEAPYRKLIQRGKMPTDKVIEVQCRAMAEGILRGWEGLGTPDGPLPYTHENAYLVLRHNPEIRDFIFEFAVDAENYRKQEIEETGKK